MNQTAVSWEGRGAHKRGLRFLVTSYKMCDCCTAVHGEDCLIAAYSYASGSLTSV